MSTESKQNILFDTVITNSENVIVISRDSGTSFANTANSDVNPNALIDKLDFITEQAKSKGVTLSGLDELKAVVTKNASSLSKQNRQFRSSYEAYRAYWEYKTTEGIAKENSETPDILMSYELRNQMDDMQRTNTLFGLIIKVITPEIANALAALTTANVTQKNINFSSYRLKDFV